jgi:hypothetical protein
MMAMMALPLKTSRLKQKPLVSHPPPPAPVLHQSQPALAARSGPKIPPAAHLPVENARDTRRDPVAPQRAQSHDSHWQELWWVSPAVHVC